MTEVEMLQAVVGKTIEAIDVDYGGLSGDTVFGCVVLFTDGTRLGLDGDAGRFEEAWMLVELNPTDG